jgi:tellurite resistance protein
MSITQAIRQRRALLGMSSGIKEIFEKLIANLEKLVETNDIEGIKITSRWSKRIAFTLRNTISQS